MPRLALDESPEAGSTFPRSLTSRQNRIRLREADHTTRPHSAAPFAVTRIIDRRRVARRTRGFPDPSEFSWRSTSGRSTTFARSTTSAAALHNGRAGRMVPRVAKAADARAPRPTDGFVDPRIPDACVGISSGLSHHQVQCLVCPQSRDCRASSDSFCRSGAPASGLRA
jgi:hypothetical protein